MSVSAPLIGTPSFLNRLFAPKTRRLENRGVALARAGKNAGALDLLEQAVALDPSMSQAWFSIGSCRAQLALRSRNEKVVLDAYGKAAEAYKRGNAEADRQALEEVANKHCIPVSIMRRFA